MTLWQPTRGLLQPNQHWRRPARAAFSPLSLAPPLFALGQMQYLFQAAGGSTPVTEAGQPIASWLNIGTENDYGASSGGERPSYQTSAGLQWVEFDGNDDSILFPLTIAQPFTLVVSGRSEEFLIEGARRWIFNSTTDLSLEITAEGAPLLFAGSGYFGSDGALVEGADFVLRAEYNGAASRAIVNGIAHPTGNAGSVGIADALRLSGSPFGRSFLGRVAGIGLFTALLSDEDGAAVDAYMGALVGLSL